MDSTYSWIVNILIATATLLGLAYYYFTSTFDHWKKLGIPFVKPIPLFGNIHVRDQFLQRKPVVHVLDDIYKDLGKERFGGYFEGRTPVLMLRDPLLIERILVKDFTYFHDRAFIEGVDLMKKEPLTGNLFSLKGQLWKSLRNKLTPTFTTGKLRGMLEQIDNSGEELVKEIEKSTHMGEALNGKTLGTTFSIDATASVSFGLQFKPDSPEGKKFREIVDLVITPTITQRIRLAIIIFFQRLAVHLNIKFFPKEVTDYVVTLVKTTMDFRKKNNIQRNDFLQLLMNLKEQEQSGKQMNWKSELSEDDSYLDQMDYTAKDGNEKTDNLVITDECIAAQSFVFIVGGSEAVAHSVQFSLFELAVNPDIQARLQQEVDSTLSKHGGNITYEGLKEMHYMDMFIQEKNRRYSEGAFLQRVCTASYSIPDTDIVLEKGTRVVIPIHSLHYDPANYPEPEKFIPERFEGNNFRASGKYLPFGDGPRVCIAMRFVLLELKVCLAKILSRYSVTLDPQTPVPLEYDPKSFALVPKPGIFVKFQRRTKT